MLVLKRFPVAIPLLLILCRCAQNPPCPDTVSEAPVTADTVLALPADAKTVYAITTEDGTMAQDSLALHAALEAVRDSTVSELYEFLFLELHREIAHALGERERNGMQNGTWAEVRAIVKAAEEIYLEGNSVLAATLLSEAELLLRQTP